MSRNTQTPEWVKVASRPLFNLYRSTMDATLWQARLNGSGNYLRRRFHAPSLERALVEAPRVVGLEKPEEQRSGMLLGDAFTMALNGTNRREKARAQWLRDAERFFRWLAKRHPVCTHWSLLERYMLREYLVEEFAGRAANTKRLAMQPVLQTAGFMHREFGLANIGERLGIGNKLKTLPRTVYLEDVVLFCDFLRDTESHLEVGACLQGLAGLQLLEALRLTWSNVDLDRGLIEITGEVKNEYRNRVIPVAGRVLEALRRADERRRKVTGPVQQIVAFVVVGERGLGFEDSCSYSRQMRRALKAWNAKIDWAPKDLRNCLPTFSKMEGIHGTIWEQYIGHAPRSVTDRHCVPRLAARSSGEQTALVRQMDLFRRFVTVPVEAAMKAKPICNFLQLGAESHSGPSVEPLKQAE